MITEMKVKLLAQADSIRICGTNFRVEEGLKVSINNPYYQHTLQSY